MWTRVQTAKQQLREHLDPGYCIQAADTTHFFHHQFVSGKKETNLDRK